MRLGITGHRPNRLHIGEARVASRLREAMVGLGDAVRSQNPAAPLIACSPLAEGSDRLFAELALELGYELHALLPFASADYESTFSDKSRVGEYRALLRRAARVTELEGSLADTKSAYEAVGRAMVDHSDLLIAVWDGRPAAARGGTPEIIAYALARERPVIWIDAARDGTPQRLRSVSPQITACELRVREIVDAIG